MIILWMGLCLFFAAVAVIMVVTGSNHDREAMMFAGVSGICGITALLWLL